MSVLAICSYTFWTKWFTKYSLQQLPFEINCGNDNNCIDNLKVDFNFTRWDWFSNVKPDLGVWIYCIICGFTIGGQVTCLTFLFALPNWSACSFNFLLCKHSFWHVTLFVYAGLMLHAPGLYLLQFHLCAMFFFPTFTFPFSPILSVPQRLK